MGCNLFPTGLQMQSLPKRLICGLQLQSAADFQAASDGRVG